MQEAPKWLAERLPYMQVNQDSRIKAELKKIVCIISLSGSALIAARNRLQAKEKPTTQLINSELQ